MPPPDDAERGGTLRRDLKRGIALAGLAAVAAVFIIVDSGSHSGSDTLYGMAVPVAVILGTGLGGWVVIDAALVRDR